ncbi:MAG: hypothetical protein Q8S41_01265 [Lutibacter sp.]|nr:hypothetical protein [Lutibacter sp.]
MQWKTFFDSPFGEVKKFVTKSPTRQPACQQAGWREMPKITMKAKVFDFLN